MGERQRAKGLNIRHKLHQAGLGSVAGLAWLLSYVVCFALLGCQRAPEGSAGARGAAETPQAEQSAHETGGTPGIADLPFEGMSRGFPAMRNLNGTKLADGDFSQWLEGDRLHARTTYRFGPGHEIEETGVFQEKPQLVEELWSWRELRDGKVYRRFEADLQTGRASSETWEKGKLRRSSTELKLERGRSFAGFGFTLAIKELRRRLINGESIQLQAIGFTPKPRTVSVTLSYAGLDQMSMSGQTLRGDCFIIHPNVPKVARLFINVPDTRIWLVNPPPAGFLRWEGQIMEPSDPVVRVDLLPGEPSSPAQPVSGSQPTNQVANKRSATIKMR